MRTETLTRDGRPASEQEPETIWPQGNDAVRALAIERILRLRRFKLHLVAFALGVPILGVVWVLSEYYEEHSWPDRFASAPDVKGTWDTWFFWVAGIWAIALAVHALRTYFGPPLGPVGRWLRRPAKQAQVDREIERLSRS
jgi:hypothetical protein